MSELFDNYSDNDSNTNAKVITDLYINHDTQRSLKIQENMWKQLGFGAGSDTHYIPEFDNEHVYIPLNPSPNPCLVNCVLKQISIAQHDSAEYKEEVLELFKQFIGKEKITKGRIPQSKLV